MSLKLLTHIAKILSKEEISLASPAAVRGGPACLGVIFNGRTAHQFTWRFLLRLVFWPLLVFEIVDKGRDALLVAVARFPSVDSVPQCVFQGMGSQGKKHKCFNGISYMLFWPRGESGGPAC